VPGELLMPTPVHRNHLRGERIMKERMEEGRKEVMEKRETKFDSERGTGMRFTLIYSN
jgi:hypothetical protein